MTKRYTNHLEYQATIKHCIHDWDHSLDCYWLRVYTKGGTEMKCETYRTERGAKIAMSKIATGWKEV